MRTKRFLTALVSAVTCLTLATACGNSEESSQAGDSQTNSEINLTVWGAQEDQELLQKMCREFATMNAGKNYKFSFGVVSEADAKKEVLKDLSASADVFGFASDQIADLVSAGALYRVTKNKEAVVEDNTEASVLSATVGGELYGYPSSSDTYFMYYDKSKFSEDEVQSLEKMLAKDIDGVSTNVAFDLDNGWYQSAFFFGAGCTLFGEDGSDPTQCDFNNERGYLVGEYLIELVKNRKFGANFDDGLVKAGFSEGTLGSAISGTWNASDIEKALGENYGATKLPTFTLSNGEEVQMGGMANFKIVGVNAETKHPLEAMQLAEWLTNYENQLARFEQRSFAPTNKALSNDEEALSANIAVSAQAQQAQYSTVQASIPQSENFWTPAEAFGQELIAGKITTDNLQQRLDAYVKSILATLA